MPNLNNKRIVKNTGLLYFRMIFIMFITLYTSRVVLNTLGIVDFGIYNVVGGVVVLFSFINSAMSASTQRFLNFEMGNNDSEGLNKVFSMSVSIHLLLAILIFILAETIGLWFLNTQLTIPSNRLTAANWVYQFSVLATLVTIITVPYNAAIIANEKMTVFAYISIFEVVSKLIIVYVLQLMSFDKLKLYAILLFFSLFIVRFAYVFYCRSVFVECHYNYYWNKVRFKEMSRFTGWNFLGASSGMIINQGVSILLNIFFGPTINAARSIAIQVQGAVGGFVTNFMTAVNPQIVKSYASGDKKYMFQLVYLSSKYSFYLLYTLSLPLLINTQFVLVNWLGNVPSQTLNFTQLSIIYLLTLSLTYSLNMAAQASGDIKVFQLVESGVLLLNLPVSFCLFKLGYPPSSSFFAMIVLSIVALLARLYVLKLTIGLCLIDYFNMVVSKVCYVCICSCFICYIPIFIFSIKPSLIVFILQTVYAILSSIVSIWIVGMNVFEKVQIKKYVLKGLNLKW